MKIYFASLDVFCTFALCWYDYLILFYRNHKYNILYEKLKSENIDLIISTVHHIPEITSNSYMLKTPMRIVVTDYEFPFKQWFHLNHLHNSIKYWTPVNNYQGFFRSMVKHNIENNYWETSLLSACSNIIYQNMFNSSPNKTLEEISDELEVFEFLPFPSSTLFRTPTDQTDIMKNRQEINLSQNSDRKILTLALGGAPNAEEMIIVLKQMLQISNKIDSKVQVAIVSAGNNSLIQEVSEFLMSNSMRYFDDKTPDDETNTNVYADKITFKILPRLEYAVNMPKLYKSTDIIISKSGGASTAEVINTSTPFIRGFKLWSWEIENTKYLEKLGLAFSENLSVADLLKEDLSSYYSPVSNESLLNQINYHLAKSRPVVNVEKFDNNYLSNAIHNAIK